MSNLRQAAEQALDYLDAPSAKLWPAGTQHRIITALRAALAEQNKCTHGVIDGNCKECYMAAEPVAWVRGYELPLAPGDAFSWVETPVHTTPLYTAPPQRPAEPVQEPVAWADKISFENAMKTGKGHDVWPKAGNYEVRTGRALIALYTAPPPQVLAPRMDAPQRKPLTDEELPAIRDGDHAFLAGVRFAEAAHRIKEQS